MPTRTWTMVQFTDDLLHTLDARAARDGVSRARLIRDAIEQHLAHDRSAELDRQIVEGYRSMPQGGEFDVDEWGDLDPLMAGLAAEQGRRLSVEVGDQTAGRA